MTEVPNLTIELEPVNPNMDAVGGRYGRPYVAGNASKPDILGIYYPTGRHVSTMKRQRYQHLYSWCVGVSTEVKEELMNNGFVDGLVSLVARYQGKSGVDREKWFRNQWTVLEGIIKALREGLDLDTKM